MKCVEYSGKIGWKVYELPWNLHEIEFAHMRSHFTKGVFQDLKKTKTKYDRHPLFGYFSY